MWRSKGLITILILAHGLFPLKNEASFPHHELANTIQYIKDKCKTLQQAIRIAKF
jgi:hypothetical protein